MSYIQHKSEESLEDYLETILVLSRRLSGVRSIDVANELNFSKPSVSVAMKNLKNRGYITVGEDGYITLSDSGKELAESVYERHTLLTEWLIHLGVNPEIAARDACKMEHDITSESYEAMKKCIKSFLEADQNL
ncbi:MAG: metal-dependent transcriptional regulator [Lachnospiraceae bacterium]|nr:metal-dependent transcriptional regulator [Lachnospiraceae bacterium]